MLSVFDPFGQRIATNLVITEEQKGREARDIDRESQRSTASPHGCVVCVSNAIRGNVINQVKMLFKKMKRIKA